MARRAAKRDMTVEEFDAWVAASKRFERTAEAADERGGPSLSLVPVVEQDIAWPTDLLPPSEALPLDGRSGPQGSAGRDPAECPRRGGRGEGDAGGAEAEGTSSGDSAAIAATPFDGVELPATRNRLAGWSAERQRYFLATLAETGSVHLAASAARLSARSAYKLRTRSPAFAAAWDAALSLAATRLTAIAFDRAINGRAERFYKDGELVMERRIPSDYMLTWLLTRLDPAQFGSPTAKMLAAATGNPRDAARADLPALAAALRDVSPDECECDDDEEFDLRTGEMTDGKVDTAD